MGKQKRWRGKVSGLAERNICKRGGGVASLKEMSLSFYFFLLPTLPPQICRLVVSCFGLPLFPLLLSLDLSGLHAKPPRVNICVCTPHHATNQSVSINNSAITAKERKKETNNKNKTLKFSSQSATTSSNPSYHSSTKSI